MSESQRSLESPCIHICALNDNNICVGCYRHIDEIVVWGRASDQERQAILERVAERKKDQPSAHEN